MNNECTNSIVQTISHFREGELDISLDAKHVSRWVSQFAIEYQYVILQETANILSEWYFSKTQIEEQFLDQIISFLKKKYSYDSISGLCNETVFLQMQDTGQSQKQLNQMLKKHLLDYFEVEIDFTYTCGKPHYVYIDDGLYTGRRARKDLSTIIHQLLPNNTLDVFFVVAGTKGLNYVKDQLSKIAKECKIELSIYSMKLLENTKKYVRTVTDNCEVEEYTKSHYCLWPEERLQQIEPIKSYENNIKSLGDNYEKELYRKHPWKYDQGIFSSPTNRNIVEREFLIKGIEIVSSLKENKGIYPLGFNLWPSFGFGSFCATDFNVSNTCPLVLWWGNTVKQGNALDNWYPLLPRRTNSPYEVVEDEEWVEWTDNDKVKDQYYMCPDCGRYYGIDSDGGNGFCIDCAWKH